MGICPSEADTCQNAENESRRRAKEGQYQNTGNRENIRPTPSVVFRRTEIQPSGRPVETIESQYSLKHFSELFLGTSMGTIELTAAAARHKSIQMRTTLDLPDDVGRALREESARRGGRGKAPISQLVAEAVRAKFGHAQGAVRRQIGVKDGLPVVRRVYTSEVLSMDTIERALADCP